MAKDNRRLFLSTGGHFSLANYLDFSIERGAEDSADPKDLDFEIMSANLDESFLVMKVQFKKPLLVSIGSKKDVMLAEVVNGQFFSTEEDGVPIPDGTTFNATLPK